MSLLDQSCPTCGDGVVRALAVAGRRMLHRQAELEIPAALEIATCDRCGAEWLDAATSARIQTALDEALERLVSDRAVEALSRLESVIPRRELERLVGVSPGYFSRLRAGKEPSATLTSLLLLLAAAPGRIDELRRLWTSGVRATAEQEVVITLEPSLRAPIPFSTGVASVRDENVDLDTRVTA